MLHEVKPIKSFRVGLPIVPLEVGRLSNAIITEVEDNTVTIVSDFGNEMKFTYNDITELYGKPEWADEHMAYYDALESPFNALRERFETQIELLQKQLEQL